MYDSKSPLILLPPFVIVRLESEFSGSENFGFLIRHAKFDESRVVNESLFNYSYLNFLHFNGFIKTKMGLWVVYKSKLSSNYMKTSLERTYNQL